MICAHFDAFVAFAFLHPGANLAQIWFSFYVFVSNDQICTQICTMANVLPSRICIWHWVENVLHI